MSRRPLLAALACGLLAARAPAAAQASSIAAARRQPLGSTVTVEGIVSVPSGAIDAGFALQDDSAGIYVAADSATRVEGMWRTAVTGQLVSDHGLLAIRPADVRRVEMGAPAHAMRLSTSEIGERTEGRIVSTRGKLIGRIEDDAPHGWKLVVDDGSGPVQVFVPAGQRFDPTRFKRGQTLSILGLSGEYDGRYEIVTWNAAGVSRYVPPVNRSRRVRPVNIPAPPGVIHW